MLVLCLTANYKAVCCLSLATLNYERSFILLQHFIESGQVLSPQQVSRMEHILPIWTSSWYSKTSKLRHQKVQLGVRVSSLNQSEMTHLLSLAGSHYKKGKYILLKRGGIIDVILHKQSTAADILQSYVHALVMGNNKLIHGESRQWMDKHYEAFMSKLQTSGWKTERLLASSIVWRANWTSEPSSKKMS
ncbi:hypothetical protein GIB67_000644 [Kingdonia uniflora]|uniref:Root UVB sensitive protein C-terminal domain-containing protein n=1 Tax=Kingdonia uniflora TaxID=39325 RepID=A0A7J7NDH6_9MAGN|nr:hypothetical protein GIB67_000644 [Kingdonia uniflora]